MVQSGKVTERSFYPALKEEINSLGGTGVTEVSFNSEPDMIFSFGGHDWILSVKIGDNLGIIKSAVLQYLRHKEESNIKFGLLLMLPEAVRNVAVEESALKKAIRDLPATVLVDAGSVKEELRDRPFPAILHFLRDDIIARLSKEERGYYTLNFVVSLLQQQVSEMMNELHLDQDHILRIVTNKKLLINLAHIRPEEAEEVGRFLSSYILMSQILFLRLFFTAHKNLFTDPIVPISKHHLRKAFQKIRDINYEPIYSVDVLDNTPDKFVKDTFTLIWGLEIERAKHELPGRVFHELMPSKIRKMLAAFYTRPWAADLLANLSIKNSSCSVFDPACGSGTILVSAYKRKLELHKSEGRTGNPHKRYCEEEIYGADIMPFSVHLTEANLAAIDIGTKIDRTQIIQGDSLKTVPGLSLPGGILQIDMFPGIAADELKGTKSTGEKYTVKLTKTDIILMNPPFTKVERGIANLVDMVKFKYRCGGEVGLWGHFIALADEFLKQGGTFGAVLPINILRGRESEKVRHILFNEWTPLYILKPVMNYAFSEWAEYRDVLFIAVRSKQKRKQKVKFCLIKKDLGNLDHFDIKSIAEALTRKNRLRSSLLDIDSHSHETVVNRFANMMWFCSATDFGHRDKLIDFISQIPRSLGPFPANYFKEGFRPVPKGVSKFLFLTRHIGGDRVKEAFLQFHKEGPDFINCTSPLGAAYQIEKKKLTKTLRTPIGLNKMDISGVHDYITHEKYDSFERVRAACRFTPPPGFIWSSFWDNVRRELDSRKVRLVVMHRINPYAPATYLTAFLSRVPLSPSNQVNLVMEDDLQRGKATCVLMNSSIFLTQFFLLKEESTGRFINIRFYDLNEMTLYPKDDVVAGLAKIYDSFCAEEFPCLRNQLDQDFELRYKEFWKKQKGIDLQKDIWGALKEPIRPSPLRIKFDLAISACLGMSISADDLGEVYDAIVRDMIITRHLTRD